MKGRFRRFVLPSLAGTLLASCGSDDSGGGSSAPAIVNLGLSATKRTPARIEFELQNAAATVELRYHAPSDPPGSFRPMQHLAGIAANPAHLGVGSFALDWDFAVEDGLDPAGPFEPEVEIEVAVVGQTTGSQRAGAGVGNDLPRITSAGADVDPGVGEVSGIVLVDATLEDTPGDRANLRVEFSLDGRSWQLARPAQDDETPGFAFTNVVAELGGTEIAFFWDTAVDLGDADTDALVRFVPFEDVEGTLEQGTLRASTPFHLDNNAAPSIQLFTELLVTNPDERRGIPVPFRVVDEESDLVEVILQWRRPDEDFPGLPSDPAALDAVLADPAQRATHHVCTPYPRFARGRALPVDATHVRLPELALGESWALHAGLAGRTLELLRPSAIPGPITPTWSSNPLVSPIAALPLGDGLTALVLDLPGNGRLREIELATGAVVREIASLGQGIPSTMAIERGEEAVLVAIDDAGTWRIERVGLATGIATPLVVSDGSEPAPVRGIASLGTKALVFTAGLSFFHLDYRDPPQLGKLLGGLATPWGVVVDPLPPHRVYLAERDADRVLALELDSHGRQPVVVRTLDLQPAELTRPTALALEERGARLLAVTEPMAGSLQLVGLELGAEGANASYPIGPPLPGSGAHLASGAEELRLLAPSGASELHELLVGGGLEQRRELAASGPYDPATQRVEVVEPFDPQPSPGQPWRIGAPVGLPASPAGFATTYLWDTSTDLPGGGSAFLRAQARDAEVGLSVEGAAAKPLRAALEVEPLALDPTPALDQPFSVAAADLDGDGDLELVATNFSSDRVTVFFQESPGSFRSPALALDPTPDPFDGPRSVAAADLDGDGDLELVAANPNSDRVTVFFQESPGSFRSPALALDPTPAFDGPSSVAAADLDGDGDLELVAANQESDRVTVFFQESPGSFRSPALALDPTPAFDQPRSVAAADLDGDGDLELVAANFSSDRVTVFFQESPGSFRSPALALDPTPASDRPVSVAAADLDGDGDLELVAANPSSDRVTVFFQESPGSFRSPALALDPTPAFDDPFSVAAADLDGDGDLELVAANFSSDRVTVFFQESPGAFRSPALALDPTPALDGPGSVAAADLDGDGDLELVAANQESDRVTVFFQESPGSFRSPALALDPTPAFDLPVSVAAADLDGDGDLELVAANQNSDRVTVFFQESPGAFRSPALALDPTPARDLPVSVAAADLDGDGDLELVAANQNSDRVTVFFQESPGAFRSPALALDPTPARDLPVSVAAADLDGDGDLELVAANQQSDRVTVFFQESPGAFRSPALALDPTPAPDGPFSVAAADIDGDGDLELVAANFSSDRVTVFFQESPGSFRSPALALDPTPASDAPVSVAAADLDGDGDLELVAANQESDRVTVFFQESPGSFRSPALALDPTSAFDGLLSVAAADLDGDGDLELVAASSESDRVTVFFQESPGAFRSPALALDATPDFDGPFSVAAADLDGDGDLELVAANQDSDRVTVFWGGR